MQKPQHHVERGSAPAFEGEKLRRQTGIGRCHGQDVMRAQARRQQRLLRVAYGRVGDEEARLVPHPLEEALWSELVQTVAAARWDRAVRVIRWHWGLGERADW